MDLNDFYLELKEQIILAKEDDTTGFENEDFLSEIMLEYLEEAGEIEEPVICPFRERGLQMNAYYISDDYESVDIVVSIYIDSETPQNVSGSEIDAALKRAVQLLRKAINDLYESLQKDNYTYEFAAILHNHKNDIKKVRIIAITNGLVKVINFNDITIDSLTISFSVWDVDRLFRCISSGKMRETVEIDFAEKYQTGIECIVSKENGKYSTFLAILNGEILSKLYEEYGSRLLERNVRSFLQVKGQVNKGIRDSLKNEPEMFLAYNNGISVTAESIETSVNKEGRLVITKIRDMQIVNGGQTTASIYNAYKKENINLSKVFVQMKLSVISKAADMDEIIPKISAYSNTQNKVQVADFSANDPFHRKIEEMSRTMWAPALQGGLKQTIWFYERARGQYLDLRSRENTSARKRLFEEQYPKRQLFTKTDLAKYENTWDQLPHIVSKGAQKNFKEFMIRLNDRGKFTPDTKYFEHLIAKAILFKRADKIIEGQNYGGYKVNIVTYTLAFLFNKTSQRINLNMIWKNQALSPELEKTIIKISEITHNHIINPPGGANISEWCKTIKCWNSLKEVDYEISPELERELISFSRTHTVHTVTSGITSETADEKFIIEKVKQIPSAKWFALSKWAKETDNFQGWQRSLVFTMGTIIGRNKTPTFKQANQALKVYEMALNKGFK